MRFSWQIYWGGLPFSPPVEKRVPEDEMARWHHQCNRHELGQTPGDDEGQRGLACCSPRGCKESDIPGRLNNNNNNMMSGKRWAGQMPFLHCFLTGFMWISHCVEVVSHSSLYALHIPQDPPQNRCQKTAINEWISELGRKEEMEGWREEENEWMNERMNERTDNKNG